jgi:hypothetical protein
MIRLPTTLPTFLLALLAVLTAGSSDQTLGGDPPLVGTYVVVAARAASDVATSIAARDADQSRKFIGTKLRAGDSISWYRERCEARPTSSDGGAAMVERNLADLQLAPASLDARLNQSLIVDCLGRAASDIWHVLVVDQRVLVARSSPFTTYLILEQPLAPGDISLLKQRLRQAGFDPGPDDELMNESTRAAIAAFARKNGAPALLMPGIITVNLLNALAERTSH